MSHVSLHLQSTSQSILGTLRKDGLRIVVLWALSLLMKYLASALFIAALMLAPQVRAQSPGGAFADGERLTYKVRWSFIRIGTVVITQRSLDPGTNSRYLIRMTVKSADGLPFLSLHFIHEAVVTTDPVMVVEETIIAGDDSTKRTTYRRIPGSDALVMIDSLHGAVVRQDTIPAAARCYDAMSLLMFTRQYARTGDTASLPTINDYSIGMTRLNFRPQREMLSVCALDDDVRSVHFTGTADWVGSSFAGMSGQFCGWLSDDEAAVPLRAEVKILLGSVVLELESFERARWQPDTTTLVMH